MAELFEITMVLCFGASWPFKVAKSYRTRSANGSSISFSYLIFIGYIAGITAKLLNEAYMLQIGEKWYVLFFYVLNLIMVGCDILLYYRNRALDRKAS